MAKKIDPISKSYFIPLEKCEAIFRTLFYFTGVLSIAVLFLEDKTFLKDSLSVVFIVSTVLMFLLSNTIRLYLYPRAQTKRQSDFLRHAYSGTLDPENTKHYYNNEAKTEYRRLVSQLLENLFYSKRTGAEMVRRYRIQVLIYAVIWILVVTLRTSDYSLILIISQLIFSEQILSQWFRLEKLQGNCESLYEQIYKLATTQNESFCDLYEILTKYETVKAITGITYSARIFEERQSENDKDWNKIRESILKE